MIPQGVISFLLDMGTALALVLSYGLWVGLWKELRKNDDLLGLRR